ncbi:MFS transporter [Schlegelella sp. S2-27]|uniref:MFS transporter n=1 Tax=Caldimonas mangrovi TaxID=2944811 RepID=A0ABT0YJY3_9BURK|nr:MFS transporter [Caldimonas mangrovi]MCM5679042.1 MFS transporter [Caldimonas mangrovi]
MSSSSSLRMTAAERRASGWLAGLFALRMLGLFLILPVFALHARSLPSGEQLGWVGLAIGIYGLTQAMLQIPLGWASDRYGRKPVITAGLLVFAAGSFVAAAADSLLLVTIGRALQGAGAISAAITALIADSTRDEVRTKAMAMVGGSISLSFALSLTLAPWLYAQIGMAGLFTLTGLLAVAGCAVVWKLVPDVPAAPRARDRASWHQVLLHAELARLSGGVFLLHTVQMAMFVVIPIALVEHAQLPVQRHGWVYLGVVLASLAVMLPVMFWSERRQRVRTVFLAAIGLLALTQVALAWGYAEPAMLVALLVCFFIGFNLLEATLPSLVSRVAPPAAKGLSLGVFNTCQSLGLFAGGLIGGKLAAMWGYDGVFKVCALLCVAWLVLAWPMRPPARQRVVAEAADPSSA